MPIPAPPAGFTIDQPDVDDVDLPPLPPGFTLDAPGGASPARSALPANIPPPPAGFVLDDVDDDSLATNMDDIPAPPPGFTIDTLDDDIPPPPPGFVLDQPMPAGSATRQPRRPILPRIPEADPMPSPASLILGNVPLGPELPNENDDNRLYQLAAGIEPIAPYDPTDGTVKIPQGPPAPTSAMPAGYVPFSLRPGNDLATAAETVRANNWVANLPAIPDGLPEVQDAAIAARNKYLASNPPPQFKTAKAQQILAAGLRGATRMGETRGYAGEMAGNVIPKAKAAGARALAGLMDFGANNLPEGDIYGTPVPGPPKPAVPKGPLPESEKLRQIAREADASQLPPGTTGARIFDTAQDATINTAPTIVAGVVGGPPAAAAVAAGQAMGTTYDRVYTRLKEKGYADEEAVRLASIAGLGSGGIAGATGGVVGSNPVSKNITGRLIERAAEGAAFGAAQAAGDETLAAAATGDKADFARVPTDAGVGGAISFGMGLLAEMFSRGKARHHRPAREQLERQIKAAKTPADVERAIDDARAVTESIEEALDVVDAPAPAVKPPTAPRQPTPQEQSLARDLHEVAGENRDVEALRAREQERQRRAQQERRYTEQELPALREADQRDASLAEDQRLVDEENALVARTDAHRRERQARAIAYTPDDLLKLDNRQIKQVADDLGVHFDTRGLSMARVMDAQRRAGLENLTSTDLYRRVKELGLKAGTRQKNIGLLLDYREPIPAQKSGPVPSASTGGSALKDQSPPGVSVARADQTVARDAVPVKPRPSRTPFSRAAVEQKLLDYHEETGGGYTADDDAALQRHGGGDPFTFFQKLPGEIKRHIENNPASRRLFKVTDYRPRAGGEDSMHELGDRYWQIVDNVAGSRVKAAKETARRTNDPAIQFWNAVHDNMPPMRDRSAQNAVDPKTLQPGQEFELHGSKFQVLEDADGFRLLRDGDDYPETPLEAFAEGEKIPVDRGTLRQSPEPDLPDDPFAGVRDEPSPTPQPGGGQLRAEPAPVAQPTRPEPGAIVHFTDHKGQPAVGRVEGRNFGHEGGYFVQQGTAGPRTVVQSGNMRAVEPGAYKVGDAVRLRGYRGVSEITEYDPSTGQGYVVDETSRRLRFSYDQVLPTEQKPAAKPSFFDADQAGVSGERPGLFGQPTFDASTGNKTGGLFHEPTSVERPARAAEDARYAGKFDESATPEMFSAEASKSKSGTADPGETLAAKPESQSSETLRGGVPPSATSIDVPAGGVKQNPSPRPSKPDPRARFFRQLADSLTKQIEDKRRDMTQNATPKRMREYNTRRTEAGKLERVQKALNALADARETGTLPKELEGVKTKADVAKLVARKMETRGGYYDAYYETPEYLDTSPAGKSLQSLIENRTPEQARAAAERAQADRVRKLEDDVRFTPIEGFFPTPKPVADRLIDAADIQPGMRVLEPSAGKGDLVDAVKARGADVDSVEVVPRLRELLGAKGHKLVGDDFLQFADGGYDRVVMNPPFERGADIAHVQHAYDRLKPGGKLVSVMSDGPFFRNDKKATEFRQWLETVGGTSEKLDAGSFTGKEAFRQTGTAMRMVVIEKPSAAEVRTRRNQMRPRGAVSTAPITGPVRAMSELLGGLRRTFVDDLISRTTAKDGPVSREVAGRARRAVDGAKKALGEVSDELNDALKVAGGGFGPTLHRAAYWLQDVERRPGKNYGVSRILDAVEGRMPAAAPSGAGLVVKKIQELPAKLGRMYAANGHMQLDSATGKWRPYRTTRGDIFVRVPTDDMQRIIMEGPGGKLWNEAIDAFADINAMPAKNVERFFEQQREQYTGNTPDSMFRRLNAEFTRVLPRVPTVLYAGGDTVPLFETNPAIYAKRLAENGAARIGFVKEFGQAMPGSKKVADLYEQFTREGGNGDRFAQLMRALNNVAVEKPFLQSGSALATAARGAGQFGSLLKAGLLSMSAVQNIPEPLGNTQGFGSAGDLVRAVRNLTVHPKATIQTLESLGAITRDVANLAFDPNRPLSSVVRVLRQVSNRIFLHGYINEFQEKLAAAVAHEKADRLRNRKGTASDVYDLRSIGYPLGEAKRLAQGYGSPEEYDAIVRRAPAALMSSPLSPAEKSRASHNKVYRASIAFETYAQTKIRSFVRQAGAYIDVARDTQMGTKNPKLFMAANLKFARHIAGTTASGAAAYMLMALATGGTAGLKIAWNEAKDEPLKFLAQSWAYATFVGPFGALIRLTDKGSDSYADRAARMTFPGFIVKEIIDSSSARGAYRDMEPVERIGQLFKRVLPVNRIVATAAAARGIGEKQHELDTSLRAYWRWRMDNKPPAKFTPGEEVEASHRQFRQYMRLAYEQMKRGNDPLEWVRKGLGIKEGKDIAAAIRSKKVLDPLENDEREKLKRHIGPDAYKRLENWDSVLSGWEQSIQYESQHNVDVHKRFGGRLSAFDKEAAAVDTEMKPIQPLLTGKPWQDADVKANNPELFERRAKVNPSLGKLAKVRKEIKRIEADTSMTEEEKRIAIEEQNALIDEALQAAGY